MPTAREIMTPAAEWCPPEVSVADAARKMAERDIGALPVCSAEGRLQAVITDRDLVVQVLSQGRDPQQTTLADIVTPTEVVTIRADDPAEVAIQTMKDHAVRRLPVIDGSELVGMVSQADIARALPDAKVGDLVGAISAAPSNSGDS